MKVVVKIRVLDLLLEKLTQMRSLLQEPDYIVVTEQEQADLQRDARARLRFYWAVPPVADPSVREMPRVIDFRPRKLDRPGPYRPIIRAMVWCKIDGIEVFVVPAEYHPE